MSQKSDRDAERARLRELEERLAEQEHELAAREAELSERQLELERRARKRRKKGRRSRDDREPRPVHIRTRPTARAAPNPVGCLVFAIVSALAALVALPWPWDWVAAVALFALGSVQVVRGDRADSNAVLGVRFTSQGVELEKHEETVRFPWERVQQVRALESDGAGRIELDTDEGTIAVAVDLELDPAQLLPVIARFDRWRARRSGPA